MSVMRCRRPGIVWGLAALVVPVGAAGAQEAGFPDPESLPRPVAHAVRTAGPVRIDGRLDDSGWTGVPVISEFVQSQPMAGAPPTERTEVRIAYDERHLYIAAVCYDSSPDQLVITTLEHDLGSARGGSTRDMDVFAVTLDTFLDRRNSFIFLVSPGGAYRDGQTFNDSRQIDFAWRANASVRTVVHDSGYTVEMAIPWTTLRFDAERSAQDWGLNLLRRIRRKSEDVYWAPVDRRDPVHRMSKAGTLVGLDGIQSGRNLRLKPFAFASDRSGDAFRAAGTDRLEADAGGDLKWGITAGLTLDGTVRTDFSQVEVDREQVNLTRFPLFFPERRDFFVENSGSFVLGDVSERNYRSGSSLRDFTLFHSRRIGLAAGQPVPILGGARLTGRAGAYELGFLDIQTEATATAPAENFGVVRLRRNVGASDVGAMFINRQATGAAANGEYNRSYGIDANLRPIGNLLVNTYLARTDGHDASGDRTAARIAVGWRDRLWDIGAFARHIGDGFDPGAGFVRRRGIRHAYATLGAHPRPAVSWIQEMNPFGEIHYVTDLDGDLRTREANVSVSAEFVDGSSVTVTYENQLEVLSEPDAISGVLVPAGRYATSAGIVRATTSRARALSGSVALSRGGFFNGTRTSVSSSAAWRPHYRVSLDVSAAHNDVRLGAESFAADVYGARIRMAQSTALYASGFVQYNSQADVVVTNFRLNWVYAPLSDVFFVFTERRAIAARQVLERAVTVKVTRLLAF